MRRTQRMTTAALLTALCVVLMAAACVLPAGSLAALIVASMIPVAAVIRCGLGWGALCYAATAALVLLLFPGRLKGLCFVTVLGHYGVIKSLIERLRNLPLEWLCKLLTFNGTLALCWWLYTALLANQLALPLALPLVWALGNVVFVFYDLGLTLAAGWFRQRFPG